MKISSRFRSTASGVACRRVARVAAERLQDAGLEGALALEVVGEARAARPRRLRREALDEERPVQRDEQRRVARLRQQERRGARPELEAAKPRQRRERVRQPRLRVALGRALPADPGDVVLLGAEAHLLPRLEGLGPGAGDLARDPGVRGLADDDRAFGARAVQHQLRSRRSRMVSTSSARTDVSAGRLSRRSLTRARASSASSRARSRPCSETYVTLPGASSFPGVFPSSSAVPVASRMSSTIWKRTPSSSPNARQGASLVRGEAGDGGRGRHPGAEEPPGLEAWSRRSPSASSLAVAGDVEVLAADHAEGRVGDLARDGRRRIAQREAEGLGEQRVAGEDGDVLAEADVRARLPAPEVVVVERRQVVVHEAEGVHELERAAGGRSSTGSRPSASPVARQSTGRMRFPPPRSE